MKTKLILILTTVILSSCAAPQHCYGDTLTIYSISPEKQIEYNINQANYNINMGTDISYMGYGVIATTVLTTSFIPAGIDNNMFIHSGNMRAVGMITGGLIAAVGQWIVIKNKKKRKRFGQLK
jgi:hypothetical protein